MHCLNLDVIPELVNIEIKNASSGSKYTQ